MRINKFSMYVAMLCLACACNAPLMAQFSSSIEGTVTDPSSAAVPNANITLVNQATGIKLTTVTNGAGYYLFPSLPAGLFSVTAAGSGFKTNEITDIRLETSTRRTANITLEVGAQATVVNVKAEVAAVDVTDAKVVGMIEAKQLAELPIPGRNFMALVTLTPGVTGTNAAPDIFNAENQVNMNAAGLRGEQNGFAVDGGTVTSMVRHGRVNLQPNAESIAEVQIAVNDFSATRAMDAGASIRVTTKQGTNQFHGSASWFHQNNKLSSRNLFQNVVNPLTGRILPVTRRNEVAGGFGGPIIRNRTFFFASFDVLRQGTAANNTAIAETSDLVALVNARAPNSKAAFLLNKYPIAFRPTSNIRNAGALLPTAITNCDTLQGGPATLVNTGSALGMVPCNTQLMGDGITPVVTIRNARQWNLRGDHQFSQNDRFYANVFRVAENTTSGNLNRPIFTYPQENLNWAGNVNETHTFSPSLLNEIRVGAVRVHGEIRCVECQIPNITITNGLNGFGTGGPTPYFQNNYELEDTLTWIKGSHNLKGGFYVARLQANWKPTAGYQRPGFTFQTLFEFLADNPNQETNLGVNPKDGTVYTPDAAEREHVHAGYFQDVWKVRSNLTVTYGLRWEAYGRIQQTTLGNNVKFRSGNDMTSRIADGMNVTQFNILDNGDWNNFAPRVSFAWDPKGNGKTSIRGGAGIYYDYLASQFYGGGHFTAPLFFQITAQASTAPLLPLYAFGASGSDPYNFPRPAALAQYLTLDERNGNTVIKPNNSWLDPSLKNSYTESWSFGVQHALSSTLTVEGNYVGNVGRHIYAKYDVNRFPGDLIINNGIAKRLNPSFGSIGYGQANQTSAFNGGNLSIRQRYNRGFLFQAAYTFGHATNQSDSFSASAVDWWNLKLENATAGYNAKQKLAFSFVYDIPTFANASRLVKQTIGGWQLSGVTILQSGSPFTVSCNTQFAPVRTNGVVTGNTGCDYNADNNTNDRPMAPSYSASEINMDKQVLLGNVTGGMRAADFPRPALGGVGSLGRNTYLNPGFANTDLTILKNFKSPWFSDEPLNIQFRAEAYNAFNRANLGDIQGLTNNATFGRVTGIRGNTNARRFQLGLRIEF